MLTSRGRRTLGGALAAAVCGRLFAVPELFGLAAAAVVLVVAALGRVWLARGGVQLLARAIPDIVDVGEPAVLEITVEESGVVGPPAASVVLVPDPAPHPKEDVRVGGRRPDKIVVPRLAKGAQAHVELALPTDRRGVVESDGFDAFIVDTLGLARRPLAQCRPARCTVLPRIEPLSSVVPRGLGRVGVESTRSAAERLHSGISLLRPYSPGDDLRRIHWRTTARVGELMVREGGDRDDPDRISTTVVLDPGRPTSRPADVERAVEVAASVLAAAADDTATGTSGEFRLMTTSGVDTGSHRGPEALRGALTVLASVAPPVAAGPDRYDAAFDRIAYPDGPAQLVVVTTADGPLSVERVSAVALRYTVTVLVVVDERQPSAAGVDAGARLTTSTVPGGGRVVVVRPAPGVPLEEAWNPGAATVSFEAAG